MIKNKQIQAYRLFNKADAYILGFEYKGACYVTIVKRLALSWLYITHASHRNGHNKIIRIRLTNKHKKRLINRGAMPIELLGGYNKGDSFEHTIRQANNITHAHDSVPFYKGVDIVINGVGYSIKWENAQLFSYKTINRLLKDNSLSI